MAGAAAFIPRNTPRTLTAITRSHSSMGMSSRDWSLLRFAKSAALFTQTSIRPKSASTPSARALTADSSATSVSKARALPPAAAISSAAGPAS
jgi:hypothetical protein